MSTRYRTILKKSLGRVYLERICGSLNKKKHDSDSPLGIMKILLLLLNDYRKQKNILMQMAQSLMTKEKRVRNCRFLFW